MEFYKNNPSLVYLPATQTLQDHFGNPVAEGDLILFLTSDGQLQERRVERIRGIFRYPVQTASSGELSMEILTLPTRRWLHIADAYNNFKCDRIFHIKTAALPKPPAKGAYDARNHSIVPGCKLAIIRSWNRAHDVTVHTVDKISADGLKIKSRETRRWNKIGTANVRWAAVVQTP